AFDVQRSGSGQLAFEFELEQVVRASLDLHEDKEIRYETERAELNQHVQPESAFDAEAPYPNVQIHPRSELQRVGCDREIALRAKPVAVGIAEADRQPFESRKVRGGLERRMKSSDRQRELRR